MLYSYSSPSTIQGPEGLMGRHRFRKEQLNGEEHDQRYAPIDGHSARGGWENKYSDLNIPHYFIDWCLPLVKTNRKPESKKTY